MLRSAPVGEGLEEHRAKDLFRHRSSRLRDVLEEIPELDFLLTPCSGNGLLAGSAIAAKHLRPAIRLFGVEPEAGNDTWQSFRKGERVEIPVPQTIADGLQTPAPGKLTFPIVRKLVEDILLVSDDELIATIRFMVAPLFGEPGEYGVNVLVWGHVDSVSRCIHCRFPRS